MDSVYESFFCRNVLMTNDGNKFFYFYQDQDSDIPKSNTKSCVLYVIPIKFSCVPQTFWSCSGS